MATKSNCSAIERETPVCKFHKTLTEDKAKAEGDQAVATTKLKLLESERSYVLCSLAKSEGTFRYYRDVNNIELCDMLDSATIIKNKIDTDVKADAELGKSIAAVSKLLNDLQVKLHDANNAACSMRNCLQILLGKSDDKMPLELQCVTDLAKRLSEDGKSAATAMVSIAGIHTFSNIETLQLFTGNLVEKLNVLKALTDAAVTNAKKDGDKYQSDLVDVVKRLNKAEFENFHIKGSISAHTSTLEFICEKQCKPICYVDDICQKLGGTKNEASSWIQADTN